MKNLRVRRWTGVWGLLLTTAVTLIGGCSSNYAMDPGAAYRQRGPLAPGSALARETYSGESPYIVLDSPAMQAGQQAALDQGYVLAEGQLYRNDARLNLREPGLGTYSEEYRDLYINNQISGSPHHVNDNYYRSDRVRVHQYRDN